MYAYMHTCMYVRVSTCILVYACTYTVVDKLKCRSRRAVWNGTRDSETHVSRRQPVNPRAPEPLMDDQQQLLVPPEPLRINYTPATKCRPVTDDSCRAIVTNVVTQCHSCNVSDTESMHELIKFWFVTAFDWLNVTGSRSPLREREREGGGGGGEREGGGRERGRKRGRERQRERGGERETGGRVATCSVVI